MADKFPWDSLTHTIKLNEVTLSVFTDNDTRMVNKPISSSE